MTGIPWRIVAALGGAALVLALVVGLKLHLADDKAVRAKLASETARADSWVRYGREEKAAFDESERRRTAEHRKATASIDRVNLKCDADVREARRSAAAIKGIAYAPPKRDVDNCPLRAVVDPGRLSDALGIGTPAPGR